MRRSRSRFVPFQSDCKGVSATPRLWRSILWQSSCSTPHCTLAARRAREASRPSSWRHGYQVTATTNTLRRIRVRQGQNRLDSRLFSQLGNHPLHVRFYLVVSGEGTARLHAVWAPPDKPPVACCKTVQGLGRLEQSHLSLQTRLHSSLVRSQVRHGTRIIAEFRPVQKVRLSSECSYAKALYSAPSSWPTRLFGALQLIGVSMSGEAAKPRVIVFHTDFGSRGTGTGKRSPERPFGTPRVRLRATRIADVA